jgi:hypothetical protein
MSMNDTARTEQPIGGTFPWSPCSVYPPRAVAKPIAGALADARA